MIRRSLFTLIALSLAAFGAPALAQDASWDEEPSWSTPEDQARDDYRESDSDSDRRSDSWISVRAGLGFTGDPETFLMSVEVPFLIADMFSAGPQLRLGVSDDEVYFAPTIQAYVAPRLEGDLEPLRPYASFGLGLAVLDKERRSGRDEEDVDFLLSPGFGVEWMFQDGLLLGSGIQLDVIPGGVAGERFVFSWQVLTFRAEF